MNTLPLDQPSEAKTLPSAAAPLAKAASLAASKGADEAPGVGLEAGSELGALLKGAGGEETESGPGCGYCSACFDGEYPTAIPTDTRKDRFERKLSERKSSERNPSEKPSQKGALETGER